MESYEQWLRHPARALAVDAALREPVAMLQGVTDDAARALSNVGILTVLDLGASSLFAAARAIADAADRVDALGSPGPLPADLIDDSARAASATLVAGMAPSVLRALDQTDAARLETALPAPSVRDLGYWPPAINAKRLVAIAYGSDDPAADPEAPAELVPRMGRLPVDRVQYELLLFEQPLDGTIPPLEPPQPLEPPSPDGPADRERPIDPFGPGIRGPDPRGTVTGRDEPLISGAEFPLDITPALLGEGFTTAGIGFVLTIAQSWYSVGLSLGQLLHSLALAPGEATRVAIVDWSRRVATSATDTSAESEALRQTMDRKRAVSEVTRALNAEVQSGFSNFDTRGRAEGGSIGGAGNYQDGEYNVSVAGGYSDVTNTANGRAFASSQGVRDVSGDMTQKASDRTQQLASLDRTRRASMVTEVSVSEAERLSTRIVANYNHMHALTVLYFEVVQLYRVLTECVAADPVLYVPVRPLDFTSQIFDRYRTTLARVALTPQARDALLGIAPPPPPAPATPDSGAGFVELRFFDASFTPDVYSAKGNGAYLRGDALRAALGPAAEAGPNLLRFGARHARLAEVQVGTVDGTQRAVAESLEVEGAQLAASTQFERWARPPKDPMRFLPDPGDSLTAFRAPVSDGSWRRESTVVLRTTASWRWDEVLRDSKDTAVWPRVRYVLELLDPATGAATGDTVSVEASLPPTDAAKRMRLAQLTRQGSVAPSVPPVAVAPPFDVFAHLSANALHYTMALVRGADASLVASLLANVRIAGGSLLGRVDPVPIATVGNYLVFRCPALATTRWWEALRASRGLPKAPGDVVGRRETLVPLASGGVFAEAVLGRFNSAERLDLSRFWNWQDSPIPLVPPEIAPLSAGGRQGATVPLPTALGQANLSQQNAPGLPDPTGALVKAIETSGKGDSFRDMGAVDRLLQNGANAATLAAQGATEFMKTVMSTVTAYGARVNKGEELDKKASEKAAAEKKAAGNPAGGGSNAGGNPGGGNPGGGNPGGGRPTGGQPAPGNAPATPAGGTRVGPNDPGSAQREAFSGLTPAPSTNDGTTRRDVPAVTRQSFLVRVVQGTGTQQQVVRMDGALELDELYSVEVPEGFVSIQLRGGVGTNTVRLEPNASESCTGELVLTRLESVANRVANALPGVPEDWLADTLDQLSAIINRMPITGDLYPPRNGDGAVVLELRTEVFDSGSLTRQLMLLGGSESDASDFFERTVSIDLSSYPAAADFSETQRTELRLRIGTEMMNMRRDVLDAIRSMISSVTVRDAGAVVACTASYSTLSGRALQLDMRVVTLAAPSVVIRAR